MNSEYARIMKFAKWLFTEATRPRHGLRNAIDELNALANSVEEARRKYVNARRRIQRKQKKGTEL